MVFRPATPGFIVTLAATAVLAVVSFSTPLIKSVYFLKATIAQSGVNGSFTFGVLGYCLQIGQVETCTPASVGWEFDPNALFGNTTPIQIPEVVVKWLTYALVLHIVAAGLAAVAAVFGLLAHVREMSMTCFSSCISGFAASVALIAFIFDLVFFFVAKSRIGSIQGGSAEIGNGVWLTLAGWVLLFFSGCFFGFGRCCISQRPRAPRPKARLGSETGHDASSEALRLEAIKAEADRKARQRQQEGGLPAFTEYEAKPLRSEPQYLEEEEDDRPYRDNHPNNRPSREGSIGTNYAGRGGGGYPGGYMPGPVGGRTMDAYRDPFHSPRQQHSLPQPAVYHDPRQPPSRQPSLPRQDPRRQPTSPQPIPPPLPVPSSLMPSSPHVQNLGVGGYNPPQQQYPPYGTANTHQDQYPAYGAANTHQDPYLAAPANPRDMYATGMHHSHGANSSYHSAVSHQGSPSVYSQNDPAYGYPPSSSGPLPPIPSNSGPLPPLPNSGHLPPIPSHSPYASEHSSASEQTYHQPPGAWNSQPAHDLNRQPSTSTGYYPEPSHQSATTHQDYRPYTATPSPINTGFAAPQQYSASPPPNQRMASPPASPTSPRGPRGPRQQSLPVPPVPSHTDYNGPDAPPIYESPPKPSGLSNVPAWPSEKQ